MEADPSLTPITSVTVAWSDKISEMSDGRTGLGRGRGRRTSPRPQGPRREGSRHYVPPAKLIG